MISKKTIVILNVALLICLALWFLKRFLLGLPPSSFWYSNCVVFPGGGSGGGQVLGGEDGFFCIGNFPIGYYVFRVNMMVLPFLLPMVFFLDIFWLIRRFVKKS